MATKKAHNKYLRLIEKGGVKVSVDVYDILEAFQVSCPALQHAAKKILCAGLRGKASTLQDVEEARQSLVRAVELQRDRDNIPPDLFDAKTEDLAEKQPEGNADHRQEDMLLDPPMSSVYKI